MHVHVQLAWMDVCMHTRLVARLYACSTLQCGDAIVELGRLAVDHLVALRRALLLSGHL